MRKLAAAALVGMVVAVLPATGALAADPKPDIAVSSAADKANYAEGETFTITVTVKNKSSVDAKRVHYTGGDSEGVEDVAYGVLSTGFDLAAGATKTVQLTGKTNRMAWQAGYGFVAFSLAADNGEANDADNVTSVRLLVGAPSTISAATSSRVSPLAPSGHPGHLASRVSRSSPPVPTARRSTPRPSRTPRACSVSPASPSATSC